MLGNYTVARGYARIWSTTGDLSLLVKGGKSPPKLVSGWAKYEAVDRYGRRPLQVFKGRDPYVVELPVWLENRDKLTRKSGVSAVEKKWQTLLKLAGVTGRPTVQFSANFHGVDSIARPNDEWIVTGVEADEGVYDNSGALRDMFVTLTLTRIQDVEFEGLKRTKPWDTATLRKGETLKEFAKRVLNDGRRWDDVKALNADNRKLPKSANAKSPKDLTIKVPDPTPVKKKKTKQDRQDKKEYEYSWSAARS